MGNCFARCFGGRDARRYARSMHYDRRNSVEFECLMDESPRDEPLSKPVVTEHEKLLVGYRRYDALVIEQTEQDNKILKKLAHLEEMLELEEEAVIESRREAAKMARMSSQRQQIINPAQLLLRETDLYPMPNSRVELASDAEHPNHILWTRAWLNKGYLPGSRSRTDSTSSNGNNGLGYGRIASGSTPPSSVDLEWEHEAGFYTVPSQSQAEEESTVTIGSERGTTPISTELEWDDGFATAEQLDMETEQLISEIDQLTSQALQETNPGENNNNVQR